MTTISANDPRLANFAGAFGGVNGSTFQDFLRIVNSSPAYAGQLSVYLDDVGGINASQSTITVTGANGLPLQASGITDPQTGQISVATTIPSDPLRTPGYNLAEVVAHELGHYRDPQNGHDGVVGEARAEINAYSLMTDAITNLIASGNISSASGQASTGGNIWFPNGQTSWPIGDITRFPGAESIIRDIVQGAGAANNSAASALAATCGQATACEAMVASAMAASNYGGYYPNQTSPQLLGENGNYSLQTDPSNPGAVNIVDNQTGSIVQTITTTISSDDGAISVRIDVPNGPSTTTNYDVNGAVTSVETISTQTDSANVTTTTTTTTTYDPNTGAAVERDVVTDDGRGNINVDHYDGNGVLVSDSWNNSNGASGTDSYRSDGTLASDTWDNGYGQSGTDTYGEDGSSTSVTNSSWETTTVTVTPNPDGSTTTTTVNSFPAAAGYGGDYGGDYGGGYGGDYGGGYGTGEYGAEHGYQVTTTTTTNPDGSSTETTVSNQDGYNDTTTTVTAPDGSYTRNEWNDVGEHSSRSYNATTGEYDTSTYNADGSHTDEQQIGDTYNSTSYDANGNVTRTETDTSESHTVTTNNSDGSTTVDERAPSPSGGSWDETITTTNADGSHSETRITNDGGERVTDNYDADGHLTSESGYNDAAPSDHTSSGTIDSHWETTYNADGSSTTHETELAGNGEITHDTTTDSYGDTVSATTTIEVNGVSDQTTQNSDGSHSTAHWDDNGNYNSTSYDADGDITHYASRDADGSYSDQTYDPATGERTGDGYNASSGEHSTYEGSYDANGVYHETETYNYANGGWETVETDTINGISLTTDSGSDLTTSYYMNGSGISADQFDQYWQDYFAGDGASNDPGAGDPGTGDPGAGDGSSSTPDMAAGTTDQQAAA